MKNLILVIILMLSLSGYSQTKINFQTWNNLHQQPIPQKFNRYDSWNYLPRYYYSPTITIPLNLKFKKSNYFYYKDRKKYKFINVY